MSAADKIDHPQAQRIKTWMEHARYDDYWKSYSIKEKYHQIQAPAFFVTGWYDNLVHETWKNFQGFRQHGGSEAVRQGTKILVGGAAHGSNDLTRDQRMRWYDHYLKGIETGLADEPPINIYVMGAEKWRYEHEWPLARTQFTPFYLRSRGNANSAQGDGVLSRAPPKWDEPTDQFVYDPVDPVPTLGGQMSTHKEVWGPKDRSSVQSREDILVFTTAPLVENMEVTGPVRVRLFAASTVVDTDFTATISDVHPDGKAIHICEGIRGVTFRESLENPTPIIPDKIYEYTIDLWETSIVFKKGHRIRLEISSSNFPRYARNQNTGLPLGTSSEINIAHQTIYHDAQHPSQLILPVIPPKQSSE